MPLAEVRRAQGTGYGGSASPAMRMTTMGELVAVDFITAALLDGRGYQVRAGTIATGIAAQDVIADATAEMCFDAASGTTVIPIRFGIGIRGIATATTLQVAVKRHGLGTGRACGRWCRHGDGRGCDHDRAPVLVRERQHPDTDLGAGQC